MRKYKIKYCFIDSGREGEEEITLSASETRDPEVIVKERWRGLTCESGGLRNIISITKM